MMTRKQFVVIRGSIKIHHAPCYTRFMRNRTVLLSTFGSFGDIHPYMALAIELNRRGYRAVLGTSEMYRRKIESAGIEFAPIRPDMPNPTDPSISQKFFAKVMDPNHGTE